MAERGDFTDDEWFELRSAPWRVAMGVIEVDPSGGLSAGRELGAVDAALAAKQFDEGLIGLVVRDLLDHDKALDDDLPSSGQTAATAEAGQGDDGAFPDRVIEVVPKLDPILAKAADGEAKDFRLWLLEVATAAAEAGREGLGGLAGPKVSDEESAYLDRLKGALGL
jgi:hypothetical protein